MAKIEKMHLKMIGIRPIMFDRYPGDNKTELKPEDKMYFSNNGTPGGIVLPISNLYSFLGAENTMSAAKKLYDPRKYKPIAQAAVSFTQFDPVDEVLFMRDGKPIVFDKFDNDGWDEQSDVRIHRSVARLDKGIPNPKVRPMLNLPWELDLDITHYENRDCNSSCLQGLFEGGGMALGLGTYRGVFGKFICEWS